jgi:membrane protease YdiL (CAAX protease family)
MDFTFLQIEWQPMTFMLLLFGMIASEEMRGGSYKTFGFAFDSYMPKECIFGLLMGIVPIIILILLYSINSWITIQWNKQFEFASVLPIISLAIIEELLFRGIIFQALVDRFGMITIALLFAILFSMAHLANPSYDPIAMLNTFLASLVFSFAWYHTRGLWLPIILHISWNLVIYIMGMTLSGMILKNSLFISTISSEISTYWLYSSYGIEGTLFCTLILILFFPIIQMLPQSPFRMAELFRLNYGISIESPAGEVYED